MRRTFSRNFSSLRKSPHMTDGEEEVEHLPYTFYMDGTMTAPTALPQTGTPVEAMAGEVSSLLHTKLNTVPPKVLKAQGNYLSTACGLQILDATGGAAVACIGHGHPRVKAAVIQQLDEVEYCYAPFFTNATSEKLATHLVESTKGAMTKVFIVSSGTEAVEAALKLARQYFTELPEPQLQKTRFIAREQSYHGNTLGALAVGGHRARKAIYEPILSTNVSHVAPCYPYRDKRNGESDEQYVRRLAEDLEAEFQRVGPETVCGFVAETVAGLVSRAERSGACIVLTMVHTSACRLWELYRPCPAISTP